MSLIGLLIAVFILLVLTHITLLRLQKLAPNQKGKTQQQLQQFRKAAKDIEKTAARRAQLQENLYR